LVSLSTYSSVSLTFSPIFISSHRGRIGRREIYRVWIRGL
jgi:hypothetical protein